MKQLHIEDLEEGKYYKIYTLHYSGHIFRADAINAKNVVCNFFFKDGLRYCLAMNKDYLYVCGATFEEISEHEVLMDII